MSEICSVPFAHIHEINARNGRGDRWSATAVVENDQYRSWRPPRSHHLMVETCGITDELTLHRARR